MAMDFGRMPFAKPEPSGESVMYKKDRMEFNILTKSIAQRKKQINEICNNTDFSSKRSQSLGTFVTSERISKTTRGSSMRKLNYKIPSNRDGSPTKFERFVN